ncbi:MAG: MFS transporter [Mycobacteriales bacterium]
MPIERRPHAQLRRDPGALGAGIPRRVVTVFAIACATVVANLYYAQPLLHQIGRDLHASPGAAGLVVTMSQVGYAAGLLFVVPLGDIADRRRLVLVMLAVAAVSLVGAAVAPSLGVLAAAVLLVGLTSVVAQVLVPFAANLAADGERGRVVGTVMAGLLIGILLARTAAGLVAQALGWRVMFAFAAALMVALMVLLDREMPDGAATSTLGYPALLRSVGTLLRAEPVLRRRALLGALGFAAFSVFWTTMAFLLSAPPYRYGPAVIGLFGLAGAAGALTASRAGRLADAGHTRAGTVTFAAAILAAYAALALGAHSLAALLVGVVLLDLGVQGLHVTNQSEIYRLAPDARSRVTTAYMTSYFAGGAAGSAAGAAGYAADGWPGVCALGAALGGLALLAGLAGAVTHRAGELDAAPRSHR